MQFLSRLIFFIFLSTIPEIVIASKNDYFWLIRFLPNLSTLVQGLVRTSIPEGAKSATAEMHYYQLTSRSLPRISKGPKPRLHNTWNIHNLKKVDWQALPQKRVVSSEGHDARSHFVSAQISKDFRHDLHYPLRTLLYKTPLFIPRSTFDFPSTIFGLPAINRKFLTFPADSDEGIEIIPPGKGSKLIPSLVPVEFSIAGNLSPSQLSRTIETAVIHPGLEESSFDPTVTHLFSELAGEDSSEDNMFFAPSLNSYLLVSPSRNSALSLTPHETLVNLGLIPDANKADDSHINPDTWGEDD
ncbi:hypothetical protein [Sansalvadorimonas verongulae]|uniref:hypothetical protein n=1 Tax=Sansalvadorimonas verongulae TaxID=2172824 RepID=UPI0012BCF1CA|nr:hypothetical protein [Sansalvadorimonas verongulae]MTI15186.1 hypothetical protein [Sansalvadorimonas verongulae]